jgi:hypothetical protein
MAPIGVGKSRQFLWVQRKDDVGGNIMLAVSRKTNSMSLAAFEVTKDIFGSIDMFECGIVDVLSEDVGDSSNIKACGTSKPIERTYE